MHGMNKELNVDLDDKDFTQVIEQLTNGKIRVYNITDIHMADANDPLTTIEVDGY